MVGGKPLCSPPCLLSALRLIRWRTRAKRLSALLSFALLLSQLGSLTTLTFGLVDRDDDMLADALEELVYKTKVGKFDTDLDGLMDGFEVKIGTSPVLWDTDGDGICDGDEFSWGGNPLSASPLLSYAIRTGMERWVYRMLSRLEADGRMEEGEWALVRVVEGILRGPPPEYSRLFTVEETRGCVSRLVDAVLSDGVVDDGETSALLSLEALPFYYVVDLCQSGLLGGEVLRGDADSDGFSNLEELEAGTDPMNDLDNPRLNALYGRSQRYLVIIQGGRIGAGGSLMLYHLAKRHGYGEDSILLIVSQTSLRTEEGLDATALYWTHLSRGWAGPFQVGMYMSDVPWGRRRKAPSAGLIYPDLIIQTEEDVERALHAIASLPSDLNDIVFVVIDAHHGAGWDWVDLAPGNLTAEDLSRALANLSYGKLVLLVNGCEAEGFAREVSGLSQALIIATTSRGQLIDGEYARIVEFLAFALSYPDYYLPGGAGRAGILEALAFFKESVLRDEGYSYDPVWMCLSCSQDLIWNFNPLRGAWILFRTDR